MNVPQSLLESLQGQLQVEGRKICKEIASILGVPEKELITNVLLKMPKILVHSGDESTSCPIPVQRSVILERCRNPCVIGSSRCAHHQHIEKYDEPSEVLMKSRSLYRLERLNSEQPAYWLDKDSDFIYNSSFAIIGKYKDGVIHRFVIPNTIPV
jgi:hypothetical protein